MRCSIAVLTLGVAFGSAVPAFASEHTRCSLVRKEKVLAMEIVKARLTELGFDVRAIKSDDGCYKVKAFDRKDERLPQSRTRMPVASDAGREELSWRVGSEPRPLG
jgi:hypothetical protein